MVEVNKCSNKFEFRSENTALLLVDFQNEFVSEGGKLHGKVWPMMNETSMLNKVPKVLEKARNVNASIVHSGIINKSDENNCTSSNHTDNNNIPNKSLSAAKWDSITLMEGLFKETFWNTDFANEVAPSSTDIIMKHREQNDAFEETDLEERLRENNITTLFLCGFLTDICIFQTARTASAKGFHVFVLADGCAAKTGGAHYAALKSVSNYSTVISCEEAIELLDTELSQEEKEEICNQATLRLKGKENKRRSSPSRTTVMIMDRQQMKDQRPSVLDPGCPVYFMVGSERSGFRWLLKRALKDRDDIWFPTSPHILRKVMPTLSSYGDLYKDDNLKRLVEAVCNLVENKKKDPWVDQKGNNIIFDRERITETAKNSMKILHVVQKGKKKLDQRIFLIAIFDEIMNMGTVQNGKRTWMNLAREDAQYHSLLMTYYGRDRLRYLYTVRDPRDVMMSYKATSTGNNDEPYNIGKGWADEQRTPLGILSRNKKIVHMVKYEDLVGDNDRVLKGIDAFLDNKRLDNNVESNVVDNRNDEDADGPTWRETLSEEEIHIIESVCSAQMTNLGYKPVIDKPPITKNPSRKGLLSFSSSLILGQRKENSFAQSLSKLTPSFMKAS